MKLTYFHATPPNFGDALNPYLWGRLLPQGFLDDDPSELFVGIGSILGEVYPPESRKIVMGSGYAGYVRPPDLASGMWNIVFVRGPRSAQALDLPPEKGICDSAIFLRVLPDLPAPEQGLKVGFMPHYQSLQRGHWESACTRAGIALIDPTLSPERTISQIRGLSLLITEAMHGAIVADALRTPWVAVQPFHQSHRMKWSDWAQSVGLDIRFQPLSPSSVLEHFTLKTGRSGLSPKMRRLLGPPHMAPLDAFHVRKAAADLQDLARQSGTLSADSAIENVTARAYDALDVFLRSRGHGR